MLAARQCGKSQTAAALALREALLVPKSLVLLLSPALRQSAELFKDKVLPLYHALGRPVPTTNPRDNALRLELANGSRIVSLPGTEKTIRGFSAVRLLVVDEGSRVDDALFKSIRPMLAVSRGKLVCLSTPFGRRGWFFDQWQEGKRWERAMIKADQCPRISKEFLQEELEVLGPRWFNQEYNCQFLDAVDQVFDYESVRHAMSVTSDEAPLF